VLTHVVFFKLFDHASAPQVRDRLLAMKGKIPELLEIEVGVDIVRGERSYDVALISKHTDVAAMQRYQVHPEHLAVKAFLDTVRERSISVDFET
jgi:hypothetical protein